MTDTTDTALIEADGGSSSIEPSKAVQTKPRARRTHAKTAQRKANQRDHAIKLLLSGETQQNAYTRAFRPRSDTKISTSWASEWFLRPENQARVDELCAMYRPSDLDNPGRIMGDLLRVSAKAEADGNLTAHAKYTGYRLGVAGMIQSNVSVTMEHTLSDDQLIQRIAGDDTSMVIALTRKLGTDNSFE